MQQLAQVWSALTLSRRIFVILATLGMFAAVLALSRAATAPSLALLYSGLEASASGDVIAALEQQGTAYEVRGGAIYVEEARRDELRMILAAEGLPAAGGAGYELLDSLSGFGTTAQMFDAAYWRAKEGELARTIAASPSVRSARVHIANSVAQGFQRAASPSASVTLVPTGGGISPDHARAVRYLVASAVAGLKPEDVSVIDAESGLVLAGDEEFAERASGDRAAALKANVERLLEARVGAGRAVVELSIDTITEREAITERSFDPDTRVAISTDTEEVSTSANDSSQGSVTVASNLPEGDAAGSGSGSTSQNSETRERVNYEVSETQREVLKSPGGIRRLTVAVLVDGVRGTDAGGAPTWEARTEEELAALRELVASAVGFDEARGDVITIKSMAFEAIPLEGTEAEGASLLSGLDIVSAIQLGVLAVVALILGLFVIRPILAPKSASSLRQIAGPGGGNAPGLPSLGGGPQAIDGEVDLNGEFFQGGGFPAINPELPALMGQHGDSEPAPDPTDPVGRLRRLISERQSETVEILRSWMEDGKEKV